MSTAVWECPHTFGLVCTSKKCLLCSWHQCCPPSAAPSLQKTLLKCLRPTSQRAAPLCRVRFLPQTRVSRRRCHRMSGTRWLLETKMELEESLQETRETLRSSNRPVTRRNTGERAVFGLNVRQDVTIREETRNEASQTEESHVLAVLHQKTAGFLLWIII